MALLLPLHTNFLEELCQSMVLKPPVTNQEDDKYHLLQKEPEDDQETYAINGEDLVEIKKVGGAPQISFNCKIDFDESNVQNYVDTYCETGQDDDDSMITHKRPVI